MNSLEQILETGIFSSNGKDLSREFVPFNDVLTAESLADSVNSRTISLEEAYQLSFNRQDSRFIRKYMLSKLDPLFSKEISDMLMTDKIVRKYSVISCPNKGQNGLVILIQRPEGYHRFDLYLSKMLSYLYMHYGFSLVNIEGYSEKNKEIKQNIAPGTTKGVADYLFRKYKMIDVSNMGIFEAHGLELCEVDDFNILSQCQEEYVHYCDNCTLIKDVLNTLDKVPFTDITQIITEFVTLKPSRASIEAFLSSPHFFDKDVLEEYLKVDLTKIYPFFEAGVRLMKLFKQRNSVLVDNAVTNMHNKNTSYSVLVSTIRNDFDQRKKITELGYGLVVLLPFNQ